MKPTLAISKEEYETKLGLLAGFGVVLADWSDDARSVAIIRDCVESGLRNVYHCGHLWSWAQPWETERILEGESSVLLGDDLGGIIGPIIISNEDGTQVIELKPGNQTAVKRAHTEFADTTGFPQMIAIIQDETQAKRLVVWPTTDEEITLKFQYTLLAKALDGKRPYAYGGAANDECNLQSMLAVWEQRYQNIQDGPHQEQFRVKLAQAITMDARKKQLTIGLNTDNSDRSRRWHGMLPTVDSTVTYNGVDVDDI